MRLRARGKTIGGCLVILVVTVVYAGSHDRPGHQKDFQHGIYVVPRTPWGDPDLQGKWPGTAMVGVPMQRDPKFGTRNVLTATEFKERQEQYRRQHEFDLADFRLEEASRFEVLGGAGGPLSAPPHWFERGQPNHLASLIVVPSSGRMPPLTDEARRRNVADREQRNNRGPADSYADRSLYDRCITRGVVGSILPVIYNNGNEIVQAPGVVAIRNEMIHETRIIPVDGRPRLSDRLRKWMGDSRGYWDGDTLVVETRNMTNRTAIGANGIGQMHTAALRLVERLTRLDAETILYEITIDDPKTWSAPWTMRFPWKRDDRYGFYEYACHEGNYSMSNMLSGARADERAAAEAAAKEQR